MLEPAEAMAQTRTGMGGEQGKADIFVPDWPEGHGLFDIGITFVTRRSTLGTTATPAAQANRMASQKSEAFSRRLSEVRCPEGAFQFVPLCADSSGAWGDSAHAVFRTCADRISTFRRGHVASLWWHFLSVAFEQERERVVCHKTLASLPSSADGAESLGLDCLDMLPAVIA